MKAILEFDLPAESAEHQAAIDANGMKSILLEMDIIMRNYVKYGHEFKNADEAISEIRSQLHDLLGERSVSLYK